MTGLNKSGKLGSDNSRTREIWPDRVEYPPVEFLERVMVFSKQCPLYSRLQKQL
jgi:hypothetical protein